MTTNLFAGVFTMYCPCIRIGWLSSLAVVCSILGSAGLVSGCGGMTVKVHKELANPSSKAEAVFMKGLEAKEDWIAQDSALGLGRIKCRKAVPNLIAVLKNPNAGPYRVMGAGYALGQINDKSAIDPLLRALDNAKDPEERYYLVAGLGMFNDLRIKAAMEALQNDKDVLIARAATKILNDRYPKAAEGSAQ